MTNKTLKTNKIRNAEYYDMVETFDELYADSKNGRNYNSIVYGVHQYFRIATMISEDVGNISYEIQHKCKSWKLKRRIKRDGGKTPKYIKDEYGASKQLRYINGMAIIPIGYCKHKNPMYKKKSINKYTSEGRQEIHKKLGVNSSMIQYMLRNPIMNRSIEYNDNRISLYSGQQGKCFVTKAELTMDNMHCHHKIPLHKGGTDEYANLVLVTEDVHVLIHAESEEVILKKIKLIRPDEKMRKKIDTLRRKAEISKIIWESYTF